MPDLFTPPKFFEDVKFHRHTNRSIGWLELFYDLVYVATLIQIGNFLSDNVSLIGFGQFLIMVIVVWWLWTGETLYQNRFVVDDWIHRLLVFAQIFAVASLGLSVSGAFGDLYAQFTISYVVARFLLVLMLLRTIFAHPESRNLTANYCIGFTIGAGIWLVSLFVAFEYHWVAWLIGIGVEFLIPYLPHIRRAHQRWGFDLHHMSERFGIFTIIVLGESFVKILDDAQGSTITMSALIFSTFGLAVVYSLWWLYFSDTADEVIDINNQWKASMWLYGHLPLSAGLIAFGVAAKKAFGAVVSYPTEALNPDYRLLYTASLVLYLVALAMIDIGLDDSETSATQRSEAVIHVLGAIIIAIVGITFTTVTPIMMVGTFAAIMILQVVISVYKTTRAQATVQPMPEPT